MLQIIRRFSQLNIGQILDIYYPTKAEQDLICYLQEFFSLKDTQIAVWEVDGVAKAALRLEPYADGYLLTSLQTQSNWRRKGYAYALLVSVLEQTRGTKIYSHVDKSNIASLKLHEKCGFQKVFDYARFLDGSVFYSHITLCHENTPLR